MEAGRRATLRNYLRPMLAYWTAFALSLVVGAPLAAAETLNLRYEARWAGLPAADVAYSLAMQQTGFEARMRMQTRGLAWLFSKFQGRATATGAVAGGRLLPAGYEAVYDLRKRKDKRIEIRYRGAPDARVAYRGAGDTTDHPEIEQTYRENVIDPLTAFAAIRQAVRSGAVQRAGRFRLPVYDDQRRFDVEGAVTGRERLRLGGRAVDATRIDMLLRPIAGFHATGAEDPEDTPRPVVLYLSDDERAIPLRAEVRIAFLTAVIGLTADCGEAPCPLGN